MSARIEDWLDDDEDNDPRWAYADHDDDDEWECAFPDNCCMAFAPHTRDECHTPEMAAEYMSGE